MSRLLRALTVVLLFEMGALLLYLPWSSMWDKNYLLSHAVWLKPLILHPSVRGMVSGLGLLDIFAAFGMFATRPVATDAPPENKT
jgi:hypothetical protein